MGNLKTARKLSGSGIGFSIMFSVLALQACTTSSDNTIGDAFPKGKELATDQTREVAPGTNPNAAGRIKNTQNRLTNYCPVLRIRAGTESLRKIKKGADRDDPNNVQYLARIEHIARECKYVGNNLEISIGARGRIISGPAGKNESVKVPIRVAVQEGKCSRHFTLHQQAADIPKGAVHGTFQFVDEKIVIPAPKEINIRMFIGFDEGPYKKASAKKCA